MTMTEASRSAAVPPGTLPSTPEEVLVALASLLGVNYLRDDEKNPVKQNNPVVDWSCIPWEPYNNDNGNIENDEEGPEVDFSSFPSLSLERSAEEQLESMCGTRRDVTTHVSSLLARPILVSNATAEKLAESSDDDEVSEFIAASVSDVPRTMLQNFFTSFSTLVESRLRAYATFLARHGLALLEIPTGADVDEGIVGVEHKLETMLEMGNRMTSNAIVTSFRPQPGMATREKASEDEEDETVKVSMPLTMDVAIDIMLPRPWGGPNEVFTLSFQTTGSITGIFSSACTTPLLRVAQVDVDISKLLPCMIKQASNVISNIVEMTNKAFSSTLPGFEAAKNAVEAQQNEKENTTDVLPSPVAAEETSQRQQVAVVVDPGPSKLLKCKKSEKASESDKRKREGQDNVKDDASILSPSSCESLVDYVLHDTDDAVLNSPSRQKKRKVDPTTVAVS